jgi:hypothetical protein
MLMACLLEICLMLIFVEIFMLMNRVLMAFVLQIIQSTYVHIQNCF